MHRLQHSYCVSVFRASRPLDLTNLDASLHERRFRSGSTRWIESVSSSIALSPDAYQELSTGYQKVAPSHRKLPREIQTCRCTSCSTPGATWNFRYRLPHCKC